MSLKSILDAEPGAALALKDGSADYFRLSAGRLSLAVPVGAFSGEITDTRDIVRAQTLSGKSVSVRAGSRTVRSTWEFIGLKPDDETALVALLSEMASGWTARLSLPDGRAFLSRMMPGDAIKVRSRGLGETRVSFNLDHSPADPDILLAMNFDSESSNGGLLPDWSILPVQISSSIGCIIDDSASAIGSSSLKIESGALIIDAPLSDGIESLTAGFFYQPDYSGAPAADRTFAAWLDSNGQTLIDLAHTTDGMLRLRVGDGSSFLCATTVDPHLLFESETWTHLAFSFSRTGDLSIFIDGEVIETELSGAESAILSEARAAVLVIGAADANGTRLATGRYDALRLSARYESGESVAVPVDDAILS